VDVSIPSGSCAPIVGAGEPQIDCDHAQKKERLNMKSFLGFLLIAFIVYMVRKRWNEVDLDAPKGAATESDESEIINKVGRCFMNKKFDEGLALINANIDRFAGHHKVSLLNQRAGIYFIKGDHEAALADYKLAYELEPDLTNLTNYIEGLVKLEKFDEARPLAEQALLNPNVDRDARKMLQGVLAS
jgi:tetratricopeptide (TPR) repeat protein